MKLRRNANLLAAVGLVGTALLATPASAETAPTTMHYDDVVLAAGETAEIWYPDTWDVTECDLTVSYTLDFSLVSSPGNWETSWNSVGVGQMGEGAFGWMSSGYPASDTTNPASLDLDDKHNLGAPDRWAEETYDVLAADPDTVESPFGTFSSRYIWFDRDGVDPYQDDTAANTGGVYDIEVVYHATDGDNDLGTMIGSVNGLIPDFDTNPGDGLDYDKRDAGKSFFGNDEGDLAALNVFSNAYAPHGPIALRDITVSGCLSLPKDKDDCKNGGYEAFGFINQGQCIASVQANEDAGK